MVWIDCTHKKNGVSCPCLSSLYTTYPLLLARISVEMPTGVRLTASSSRSWPK